MRVYLVICTNEEREITSIELFQEFEGARQWMEQEYNDILEEMKGSNKNFSHNIGHEYAECMDATRHFIWKIYSRNL